MLGYYGVANERASYQTESGDLLTQFAAADGRQTDLLEMNDYLDALERTCGSRARLIAENLMAPMGECAQRILIEIQQKRMVQQRGYSHSQPRVRISQRAVREALALDKQTWNTELKRVRGFTRDWLSKSA